MRVCAEHWACILDAAEETPQILLNRFSGPKGRSESVNAWESLAFKLNSLGHGQKTVLEWKKAVTDWKSKTKAKATKIRSELNKTGGGGASCYKLSSLEERLLGIIGSKGFEGDNVPELGVVDVQPIMIKEDDNLQLKPATSTHENLQLENTRNVDHDYTPSNSTPKPKKRKLRPENPSQKLLELSERTVVAIERVDNNLSRIASSLEEILFTLKNQ